MSPAPPKVAPWRWPPAMMSMKDLFDAMRAGFDLHVSYRDSGNSVYDLSRNNIAAPIGILQQAVAHRAWRNGLLAVGERQPDGRHRLTLKPKARRA